MAVQQPNEIVKRWRVTEEKDLKPEDHDLFLNIGQTFIVQGDSSKLLDFIKDEKNQGIVRSLGCGLLGPLIEEVLRKERDTAHCQSAIKHLVQICSADKVLHILLRYVEDADPNAIADSITFLMQHIQPVLLRLGDSQSSSLGLALDALQKQTSKLPVPYSHKQEQEDKYGFGRCCAALMTFVQPFVQEVKSEDATSPMTTNSVAGLKNVLLKFCMDSLKEPLLEAQFDRESETSKNSTVWSFATELMAILSAIQEPLPQLLFYHRLRRKEDTRVVKHDGCRPTESRACLAYLLFVQLITMEVFPAVFSPVFVLQCNMEYISVLLSRKEESWILKGLQLHVKSLERLVDNSLSAELLDLYPYHSVLQNLLKVMTDCPIQHLKAKAIMVFQLFIDKLNVEAKYKFFRCIMKTSQHVGVESLILKNIQNHLAHSSKSEHQDGWFEGTPLILLLRETVSLPQGPESDLLHGMDRVMVSLNLLRYILLKEKKNLTAIWTDLCDIAGNYIKTLHVCLSMSKSYCGSELKRLHDTKKIMAKEYKDVTMKKSVQHMIVRNEKLGRFPHEAQDQVLQCALITYELMESLAVRVEEIIEERV